MSTAKPVPVLHPGQRTWIQRGLDSIKEKLGELGTEVKAWWGHEAWPLVQTMFKNVALDEVKAAYPIVEKYGPEFEADIAGVFTEPGKYFGLITALFVKAFGDAGMQALGIAESSVHTAVTAYVHNKIEALKPAQ